MSRKLLIAIAVASTTTFFGATAHAEDTKSMTKESRQAIKALGKELKGTVKKAVKKEGLSGAIGSCQLKAPEIAKTVSTEKNLSVARTSLKLRNPENKPDAWELAVLQKFDERRAAGEDPKKIDYSEVVEHDGKRQFRYMKAIPTGKLCLNCHGEQLKPEVKATLESSYPEDKALGYKVGELRGAFTVVKDL